MMLPTQTSLFIKHSLELSLWSTEKHGCHELKNVTKGVVEGKRERVSFNESYKETKGQEGNHVTQPKAGCKPNEALLKG